MHPRPLFLFLSRTRPEPAFPEAGGGGPPAAIAVTVGEDDCGEEEEVTAVWINADADMETGTADTGCGPPRFQDGTKDGLDGSKAV